VTGFMVGFLVTAEVGFLVTAFMVGFLVGGLVVGAGAAPSAVVTGIKPSLLKELATFTETSLS